MSSRKQAKRARFARQSRYLRRELTAKRKFHARVAKQLDRFMFDILTGGRNVVP